MLQAGYAIEYDFVDPRELWPSLETKRIKGLFFAGSQRHHRYEEAAGQGLLAGSTRRGRSAGSEPITIDRAEGIPWGDGG